ncbi:MOSC domain-containing protein [Miltoncostaea marina]|uniref:MOSC domain-containing protein n=1 Tax=Miltoncostaea marina TaxID=2843215 RepID=UPI001C3E576A|nr:MOSC domain-containing protein [Miltoncostaea marina]
MTAGIVSDLWRFPVKSFGGERLRTAFVGPFGILGDRCHVAVADDGETLTARRARHMLGFAARCVGARAGAGAGVEALAAAEAEADAAARVEVGEGVEVTTPAGLTVPWDDPAVADELGRTLGRGVRLVRSPLGVHDAAPIHLVTLASLAAAAGWTAGEPLDRRRFRANLVLETDDDEPFAEAAWVGRTVAIGDDGPELRIVVETERCAVTTFDPDTLERDNRVLAGLARDRENLFGVYAQVTRPGRVRVGDPVRVTGGA